MSSPIADEQALRDAAMLAIGACLLDPTLAHLLPSLHLPHYIDDAVRAIKSGDREAMAIWLRQRGIAPAKQPHLAGFNKLTKHSDKHEIIRLTAEIQAAALSGDKETAKAKSAELQAILEK